MDFTITGHGTVYLLRPESEAGEEWASEHLPEDAPAFSGAFAVEHRYIEDIAEGIQADGLAVRIR